MEFRACKSLGGSRAAFSFKNITKGETNVRNNGKNENSNDHRNGRGKIRNLHSENESAEYPHLFG
ncbi:hypothetical protein FF021_19405 [Leptospira noguchii]|nr:hypothetical protein FF021_19405 [Leptospira noguchii]